MRYLRLIRHFIAAALKDLLAYQMNFWISLLHSLLNFATGIFGVTILFSQVTEIKGWSQASTLALLGVYLTISALQRLFIGPSLDALAGFEGEINNGKFDFVLLRPVDAQFMASLRHWRPLALIDVLLGAGVIAVAAAQLGNTLGVVQIATFFVALSSGLVILYALLLAVSSLAFWDPSFMVNWLFSGIFQMARYPIGLYPGWLRLVLTWVIPIGMITTVPAQALSGNLPGGALLGSVGLASVLLLGTSALFRHGVRNYTSASS